jgi:hypothetical protein
MRGWRAPRRWINSWQKNQEWGLGGWKYGDDWEWFGHRPKPGWWESENKDTVKDEETTYSYQVPDVPMDAEMKAAAKELKVAKEAADEDLEELKNIYKDELKGERQYIDDLRKEMMD